MDAIRPWLVGLGLMILLLPSAAPAQTPPAGAPAATFSELAPMLPALQGSTLLVTDANGRTTKGRITSLTADSLQLVTKDRTRTFSSRDVLEVRRTVPDSLLNGGVIGFAAGFVAPAVICASRSDSTETAGCVGGALLLGGIPGLLIGMTVDAQRTRTLTLFRAAQAAPGAFTLSPVVGPGRLELRAALRWGGHDDGSARQR